MTYIPEKEEIIRKKKWKTKYSKQFFKHQKKNNNNYDKLIVFVSSISNHGFIVSDTGTGELFGFGWNEEFQLGLGDNENRTTLVPIKFFSSKRVVKICCGSYHSIFLIKNSQVYSNGQNKHGQLGLNDYKTRKSPVVVDIKGFRVLDAFTGWYHTVFLSDSLEVYSFGGNKDCQLGVGDEIQRNSATKVPFPEKIISVTCGGWYTFFISIQGNLYACGDNSFNQFGLKTKTKSVSIPQKVVFEKKQIIQVECGGDFTLFLTGDNQVFSAGRNDFGQLGIGDCMERTSPCPVYTLKNEKIMSIKCGAAHSFFRGKEKIWISGYNEFGQGGFGDDKNILSPKLFSIKGEKIIQSLIMNCTSIHFTEKNEIYGSGLNNVGQMFCGKFEEMNLKTFKICSLKVKRYKKRDQRLKEMWERFNNLESFKNEKWNVLLF